MSEMNISAAAERCQLIPTGNADHDARLTAQIAACRKEVVRLSKMIAAVTGVPIVQSAPHVLTMTPALRSELQAWGRATEGDPDADESLLEYLRGLIDAPAVVQAQEALELQPLPNPDTHCWDEDTKQDVWSYSEEQVQALNAIWAERVRVALGAQQDKRVTELEAALRQITFQGPGSAVQIATKALARALAAKPAEGGA